MTLWGNCFRISSTREESINLWCVGLSTTELVTRRETVSILLSVGSECGPPSDPTIADTPRFPDSSPATSIGMKFLESREHDGSTPVGYSVPFPPRLLTLLWKRCKLRSDAAPSFLTT